jgi:hypothetical protein
VKNKNVIAFAVIGALVAIQAAGAQVRVQAKVEIPGEIYPGDRFLYTIVVENAGKPTHINTAPLTRFSPSGPEHKYVRQSINFKTTVQNLASFVLTAPAPGQVRIDPVTLTVDGMEYTTNPVEFTVAKPGTTDKLKLDVMLSEQTCYVGQPILLSVTWTLPREHDNMNIQVPIFQTDDFIFEDPALPGQVAGSTNSIHGIPVEVFSQTKSINGVPGAVITFEKILIPKTQGSLSFDPITASASLPVGRVRTNDFFQPFRTNYKRFSVSSQALSLEVKPLPAENQPTGFYGLVGRYSIAVQASPTDVSVGDPITLTIRVGGNPYLKPVRWPELEKVSALVQNFRIPSEKASPELAEGYKVFTQTIRAKHDQVTEIPPIPLATFDPQTGAYRVVTSAPIPLTVAESQVLGSDDLVGFARQPANREVEAILEGLAANYEGDDALLNQGFSLGAMVLSPGPLTLWLLPLLGLGAGITVKLYRRTDSAQLAAKRRRQAAPRALQELRNLGTIQEAERPERMRQILCRYVGDRFDKSSGSLTAQECQETVAEAGVPDTLTRQIQDLVAACEASRYAPQGATVDEAMQAKALELIKAIERAAKKT